MCEHFCIGNFMYSFLVYLIGTMLFMQMLRSSRNVLDLMLGHLVNSSLGWIELYAPQLSEAAETGVDHIIHVNQTKVLVLVIYVFS